MVHYRYMRAVLEGSRFGLWLAHVFGVKPKIIRADLTPEEAMRLKELREVHEEPPSLREIFPNGMDEDE